MSCAHCTADCRQGRDCPHQPRGNALKRALAWCGAWALGALMLLWLLLESSGAQD